MPVYIHLANLIFDKDTIEKKYKGACEQFRIDWHIKETEYNQEDDELFCIAAMNLDEFNIEKIIDGGLHYDESKPFSIDFVPVSRYGGPEWKVDWLENNSIFAWHKNCKQSQIKAARYIGEELSMNDFTIFQEKLGINLFDTIKSNQRIR